MPYTPPNPRSPVTSKSSCPILSHTPYAHRNHKSSAHGSPLITHFPILSGAIFTPPDSSDNDEEDQGWGMGNLKDLQESLEHISLKLMDSPNQNAATTALINASVSTTNVRQIPHSRCLSDTALPKYSAHRLDTKIYTKSTEANNIEDDEPRIKPQLPRKKSGELVKSALRPASLLRSSSMPSTPTYHKEVHFNKNMEQVRNFFQVDRPITISAGSSQVETVCASESECPSDEAPEMKEYEWDIKLSNFPTTHTHDRQAMLVQVERIFLTSDGKILVGTVACANISFHKLVVARFTFDHWKTTSEVGAEFNHDRRKNWENDGYDRFNFNIELENQANLESKKLLLCVRYQVNGQEFWDNNESINYQVDFVKKVKREAESDSLSSSIHPSQHSPPAPQPRSMSAGSFKHDIKHDFKFSNERSYFGDSSNTTIPDQAPHFRTIGKAFSSRYDLGASLTATLSNLQSTLRDRSSNILVGTKKRQGYFDKTSSVAKLDASNVPVPSTQPDAFLLEKLGLRSAEYNELIEKFCFFGVPSKVSPKATTLDATTIDTDAVTEYVITNSGKGTQSSAPTNPKFSLCSPSLPRFISV